MTSSQLAVGSLDQHELPCARSNRADIPTARGMGVLISEKRRSSVIALAEHSDRSPSSPPVHIVSELSVGEVDAPHQIAHVHWLSRLRTA